MHLLVPYGTRSNFSTQGVATDGASRVDVPSTSISRFSNGCDTCNKSLMPERVSITSNLDRALSGKGSANTSAMWRFNIRAAFEGRTLRSVNRTRDGRLLRKLHMASIHSIAIRYGSAAKCMHSTVSIPMSRPLQLAPGKTHCHRDSNRAGIECGISGTLHNDEHAP